MAAKNEKTARRDILSDETNSNPYAPPKAQVVDPVEPPVERPRRRLSWILLQGAACGTSSSSQLRQLLDLRQLAAARIMSP
jgi:hypothetical protein